MEGENAGQRLDAPGGGRMAAVPGRHGGGMRSAVTQERGWHVLRLASPSRLRAELQLRRAAARLRRSSLFDAAWYLATYSDVAEAGLDPVLHYLRVGAAEGREPGPKFSGRDYLAANPDVARAGLNPLLHYVVRGQAEGRGETPARRLAAGELAPLLGFRVTSAERSRVTLVTDSLGPRSLFGGVATALLFATQMAARLGTSLRIVTETEAADAEAAGQVLRMLGVAPPKDIAFVFADRTRPERREIDVRSGDRFVSTAWWNTWNLLHATAPRNVIHVLQDDERMFYPHGDVHLMCTEVLATPGLRFAVNTRLLHEHFAAEGFDNVVRDGAWFEPAFPLSCYRWEDRADDGRQHFCFYARPSHPRNLYQRGLEAVSAAIERRILDPERWTFTFIGSGLADIELPRGVRPRVLQRLPWPDYAATLRGIDLGLGLMYTPHPSYPPLDLAASGAVAITNRFGAKRSLSQYSANILCVGSGLDALLEGIAQGAQLAADLPTRRRNYMQSGLVRDWTAAFGPALDRLLAA